MAQQNSSGNGATNTDTVDMALDDERGAREESPVTVRGASAHDLRLVKTALDDRVPLLRNLQKKNTDEGYIQEGRQIGFDADRLHDIGEAIDPDAEDELPLATAVEARYGIGNHLHDVIRRYVRDSRDADDNPFSAMENELCQRIERFGRRIAERAFAAGVAYRAAHPAQFMISAVEELDHQELKQTASATP